MRRAGLDFSAFARREIEIRGKREMLAIRILTSARDVVVARPGPVRPLEPAAAAQLKVPELGSG